MCSNSTRDVGLKLDSRKTMGRTAGGEAGEQRFLGPRQRGEGFEFYPRPESFKGHTLFNGFRKGESWCSVWSGLEGGPSGIRDKGWKVLVEDQATC